MRTVVITPKGASISAWDTWEGMWNGDRITGGLFSSMPSMCRAHLYLHNHIHHPRFFPSISTNYSHQGNAILVKRLITCPSTEPARTLNIRARSKNKK